MALRKKLTLVGGSLALIIDRAVADLYGWDSDTVVELAPSGESLTITRASEAAAPAPGETAATRRARYAPASAVLPERIVRLRVTENPKMHGSASRKRFDLYRDGMSVRDALAAGVWRADIQWDLAHGFIALEEP